MVVAGLLNGQGTLSRYL